MSAPQVDDAKVKLHTQFKQILKAFLKEDTNAYFHNPVDAATVPSYYEVIKKPIDFMAIKNKIISMSYPSAGVFEEEVNRLFENAMEFNAQHTVWFKEAKRLAKLKPKIFASAGLSAERFVNFPDSAAGEKSMARAASKETAESKKKEISDLKNEADVPLEELLNLYKQGDRAGEEDLGSDSESPISDESSSDESEEELLDTDDEDGQTPGVPVPALPQDSSSGVVKKEEPPTKKVKHEDP